MKSTLMKKSLGTLALGALGLMATAAQADPQHAYQQTQAYSQQVDTRQDRQMERIKSGMHEGRLSRVEFRELMHEQRKIRIMEHHFRADGVIDAPEFRRLARALDVASRNIRAEKHDRQARHAYGHNPQYN